MTTPYEKAYPAVVPGVIIDDVADGAHVASQLEAKHATDQAKVNRAAGASGTSVFDDGKPNTGGMPRPSGIA